MMSNKTAPTSVNGKLPRDTGLDLLRVLAGVMVVLIHTASQNWYALPPSAPAWQAMNIFDSMARPAVPLFLMMSGALMLAPEKELSIKKLWLRYIPRLAGAFMLWSVVYALYERTSAFTATTGVTITSIVKSAVIGQYHLWYLPVIILLYTLLPVLRAVLNDSNANSAEHRRQFDGEPRPTQNGRRRCEYMLLLFLVYSVLTTTILLFNFPGHAYAKSLADKFSFGALAPHTGYFLLGFYLYRYTLPRAARIALYIGGLCAPFVTAAATYYLSIRAGAPDERFYTVLSAATLLCAAALFIFFREIGARFAFPTEFARVIGFIASCSLEIYLVHVLFLNLLADRAGITTLSWPVPALTAVVYAASLAFTAVWKFTIGLFKTRRAADSHPRNIL